MRVLRVHHKSSRPLFLCHPDRSLRSGGTPDPGFFASQTPLQNDTGRGSLFCFILSAAKEPGSYLARVRMPRAVPLVTLLARR